MNPPLCPGVKVPFTCVLTLSEFHDELVLPRLRVLTNLVLPQTTVLVLF